MCIEATESLAKHRSYKVLAVGSLPGRGSNFLKIVSGSVLLFNDNDI